MRPCSLALLALATLASSASASASASASSCQPRTQHLSDPPYENYFYSDCNVDAQAVVTSPLPDSNLSIIGPRLIVAFPAGNSGICTFFQPHKDKNGTLAVALVNSTLGAPLGAVTSQTNATKYPHVGVQGILSFNNSAEVAVAILGSVRNIRDFTEGPSLLSPVIQDAVKVARYNGTGVQLSRLWLDNVTTTTLTLVPWRNDNASISISNKTVVFGAGFYHFSTTFNYPQLKQLEPRQILNNQSQGLAQQDPAGQVSSLSFFSYTEKLLAGGWRFLTYFGRDSLISALLLQPVLSTGNGSAMEAVIGAALERINRTDGSVCHEETIGDYATFVNMQGNLSSTAAGFTYPMIDTDYYLPIVMDKYFQAQPGRIQPLLATRAGAVDADNRNLTWGQLAYISAQKIMNMTAAFETNPSVANLIHLKEGQVVGQWRDSTYGIANARIPFDVNCALAPAALYSISRLAGMHGVYPKTPATSGWASAAARRARVWEAETLRFFQYNTTLDTARARLADYAAKNTFYKGPTNADSLARYSSAGGLIVDYGIAVHSSAAPDVVPVSHTDTAFRHFLLNATGDDAQQTAFINASANAILRPFPAGLTTPVGAVVANPALSGQDVLIANFTNAAYHGTVVWGWQLALMAKGFERQLARCGTPAPAGSPGFCRDDAVLGALRAAYNRLWDVIEDNEGQLQSEVWSWTFGASGNGTGGAYKLSPLGVLPPPPGVGAGTESDVRQLWSLTFLAVKRNKAYQ
ncbi:hypothetical protein X797_001469 [Metarhizium robertsii]|uniref:Lipoprotein n=1 Tax=Metarhizium robertsii TaxID=568076 RepID=A0A0A1V921_9HYPO|nr:hypothetical protein X797_001469 [Metarhizium robertsii]